MSPSSLLLLSCNAARVDCSSATVVVVAAVIDVVDGDDDVAVVDGDDDVVNSYFVVASLFRYNRKPALMYR